MKRTRIVLMATVLWLSAGPLPAQTGGAAGTPGGKDPSVKDVRRMHEDMAVFRVLLNRAAERVYGFPFQSPAHAQRGQTHPMLRDQFVQFAPAEGVYLKGRGVLYSLSAPPP